MKRLIRKANNDFTFQVRSFLQTATPYEVTTDVDHNFITIAKVTVTPEISTLIDEDSAKVREAILWLYDNDPVGETLWLNMKDMVINSMLNDSVFLEMIADPDAWDEYYMEDDGEGDGPEIDPSLIEQVKQNVRDFYGTVPYKDAIDLKYTELIGNKAIYFYVNDDRMYNKVEEELKDFGKQIRQTYDEQQDRKDGKNIVQFPTNDQE